MRTLAYASEVIQIFYYRLQNNFVEFPFIEAITNIVGVSIGIAIAMDILQTRLIAFHSPIHTVSLQWSLTQGIHVVCGIFGFWRSRQSFVMEIHWCGVTSDSKTINELDYNNHLQIPRVINKLEFISTVNKTLKANVYKYNNCSVF